MMVTLILIRIWNSHNRYPSHLNFETIFAGTTKNKDKFNIFFLVICVVLTGYTYFNIFFGSYCIVTCYTTEDAGSDW
jgi:hypothetical protein